MIRLQHEVRPYKGCFMCKKKHYPYYLGNDRKYYCEDCSLTLVRDKKAKFGGHDSKDVVYCPRCKGTGRLS